METFDLSQHLCGLLGPWTTLLTIQSLTLKSVPPLQGGFEVQSRFILVLNYIDTTLTWYNQRRWKTFMHHSSHYREQESPSRQGKRHWRQNVTVIFLCPWDYSWNLLFKIFRLKLGMKNLRNKPQNRLWRQPLSPRTISDSDSVAGTSPFGMTVVEALKKTCRESLYPLLLSVHLYYYR
jgi:hypothetical protein